MKRRRDLKGSELEEEEDAKREMKRENDQEDNGEDRDTSNMTAMTPVEIRGHLTLKRKVLKRYWRGLISGIELRKYGCAARGVFDRPLPFPGPPLLSHPPAICPAPREEPAPRRVPMQDARYLVIVIEFTDERSKAAMALYVGSACGQSVAERTAQHDATFEELAEAERCNHESKILELVARQPGLYRRGTTRHMHFTLTQMAENLDTPELQAEWLQTLAYSIFGKRLDCLGEAKLGPRQIVRKVTAMDELIGSALFNSVTPGFPMISELNGMRYSVKRIAEKANACVPAVRFADLRWRPCKNTPHLKYIPPRLPPNIRRSERSKRSIAHVNYLSQTSSMASEAMGRMPGVRVVLTHGATLRKLVEDEHARRERRQNVGGSTAAGWDVDGDDGLIEIIEVYEPTIASTVPMNKDWKQIIAQPCEDDEEAAGEGSHDGAHALEDVESVVVPGSADPTLIGLRRAPIDSRRSYAWRRVRGPKHRLASLGLRRGSAPGGQRRPHAPRRGRPGVQDRLTRQDHRGARGQDLYAGPSRHPLFPSRTGQGSFQAARSGRQLGAVSTLGFGRGVICPEALRRRLRLKGQLRWWKAQPICSYGRDHRRRRMKRTLCGELPRPSRP
ncbi:hypothetical protein BDZ90DRAFT_155066 [Jaminaea rosea]|uniref:Uncharacterized protein n=1 Tax=Jaminaea rosea TaxID=1569628 RepID=A0A316UTS6_9BASI|nr:hypothetical protein BDZ90DRAFT_155066 [Jaminaea rosea]PWN28689.1 hypothetical protein BDZ90DRAFT_155066 [Jaminaea rosea]